MSGYQVFVRGFVPKIDWLSIFLFPRRCGGFCKIAACKAGSPCFTQPSSSDHTRAGKALHPFCTSERLVHMHRCLPFLFLNFASTLSFFRWQNFVMRGVLPNVLRVALLESSVHFIHARDAAAVACHLVDHPNKGRRTAGARYLNPPRKQRHLLFVNMCREYTSDTVWPVTRRRLSLRERLPSVKTKSPNGEGAPRINVRGI